MVICNTTISIDSSIQNEWIAWMKTTYIPLIMNTGKFVDCRLMKILNSQDEGGVSFALMLMSKDMETYSEFELTFSKQLEQLHVNKYLHQFASFTTLLEEA